MTAGVQGIDLVVTSLDLVRTVVDDVSVLVERTSDGTLVARSDLHGDIRSWSCSSMEPEELTRIARMARAVHGGA